MVPGRYSWFLMVLAWFFMVFMAPGWFFMVPGWFFHGFSYYLPALTVSWPDDPVYDPEGGI